LCFLKLAKLHSEPFYLGLGRLESVSYALKFLGLDHIEWFVLEVLFVGLASLLLVSLLVLSFAFILGLLTLLHLDLNLFTLRFLEGVEVAGVHKTMRVVRLVIGIYLKLRGTDI
jgi:hypothetical protein